MGKSKAKQKYKYGNRGETRAVMVCHLVRDSIRKIKEGTKKNCDGEKSRERNRTQKKTRVTIVHVKIYRENESHVVRRQDEYYEDNKELKEWKKERRKNERTNEPSTQTRKIRNKGLEK